MAKFYIATAGLIILSACSEDVFQSDLKDTRLSLRDTSTTEILLKSYQVPPSLGSYSTLFVGEEGNYVMPFSFLKLGDFFFLGDTSVVIDSAYIQLTVDTSQSDVMENDLALFLGYFDFDSNYSESSTNFNNVDWIPESYPVIPSTTVEDTVTFLKSVRFYIDSTLVKNWVDEGDTEPLFILKPAVELSQMYAFYSSESSLDYDPRFRVFFHQDTMAVDTVVHVTSDLTIIHPPRLDSGSFDSTLSYSGAGAGLNSLIFFEIEDLGIPSSAVILRANLKLPVDLNRSSINSVSGMQFQLFSLKDSVEYWQWGEISEDDLYDPIGTTGTFSSTGSIQDSTLTLSLVDITQSLIIQKKIDDSIIRNFGLKLMVINSKSIFAHAAFHRGIEGDQSPRLEVLFEVP